MPELTAKQKAEAAKARADVDAKQKAELDAAPHNLTKKDAEEAVADKLNHQATATGGPEQTEEQKADAKKVADEAAKASEKTHSQPHVNDLAAKAGAAHPKPPEAIPVPKPTADELKPDDSPKAARPVSTRSQGANGAIDQTVVRTDRKLIHAEKLPQGSNTNAVLASLRARYGSDHSYEFVSPAGESHTPDKGSVPSPVPQGEPWEVRVWKRLHG